MSIFSRSRSKGHYPQQNHGSDFYQGHGSEGGFLGKIMRLLSGSRGHSRSPGHYRSDYRRHPQRHKSWS
jgi:hypothetical protein